MADVKLAFSVQVRSGLGLQTLDFFFFFFALRRKGVGCWVEMLT